MCPKCRLRSFAKSQLLTISYWTGTFTVLVDGLLVTGYQEDGSDKLHTTGVASAGAIVGNSKAFSDAPRDMVDRIVCCITKCTTAVFDENYVYSLCQKNNKLGVYILRHSFQSYWYEKEELFSSKRNTYAAVRLVVKYCNERGRPPLTHTQIAQICNLARPTVTRTLHDVLCREPELFSYWGNS